MAQRLSFFSPHALAVGARARGCLTCDYFKGELFGGHVVCERFERDSVIGAAHLGCAYWMRAIGADENLEPPMSEEVEAAYRKSMTA